jgi:hypothetical protein
MDWIREEILETYPNLLFVSGPQGLGQVNKRDFSIYTCPVRIVVMMK